MPQPISVVMPVYDRVTQLDFTGPHQFSLAHAGPGCSGGFARSITTDRLTFSNLEDLAAIESCDVLLVPGGGGCLAAIENDLFLKEIARIGGPARYLTSVCSGSLILGAAGFLSGRRAACHWAWRELLPIFGAIVDDGRIVRDGNILSGGGVTAGIDFVLALIAELCGRRAAEMVQLSLEYAPQPPFNSGRPDHSAGRSIGGGERAHRPEPRSTTGAPRCLGRRPSCLSFLGMRDRPAFPILVGSQAPLHPWRRDMSASEKPDFNDALAVGRALDLTLPDSHAVREAYAQAKAESSPWLFNHVARSWLFGAKLAASCAQSGCRVGCRRSASARSRPCSRWRSGSSLRGPSERTPAAHSPSRMTWGSVEQRLFGTRSRSTPPRRLRSIRAPTWHAVSTASHATTAASAIRKWAIAIRKRSCQPIRVLT